MDHNDESARPYVVWALGLTAAALVVLLASCLHVDGSGGCDDLGMSAVAATSSRKPADRPAPVSTPHRSVSKAPAVTTTVTVTSRHRVDVDLDCD
ncbi:hypothetical protein ACOZDE_19070 [Streptomyces griseoincarnatus]